MVKTDMIEKAENFLRDTFGQAEWCREHPADADYRIEHSFRTANIAKQIAEGEGLNVEALYIGGLLHDIGYCDVWEDFAKGWIEHGRCSARMVRPFLAELGMEEDLIQEVCYGIAIHVDDKADFSGERTSLALSIGCADAIDRNDVYRIYEGMQYAKFSQKSLEEKLQWISEQQKRMEKDLQMLIQEPVNNTADGMLRSRIAYKQDYYARLMKQLMGSTGIC